MTGSELGRRRTPTSRAPRPSPSGWPCSPTTTVVTILIRRLDTTIREFRLLHYNLTAARAFFQVALFSMKLTKMQIS